MSSYTNAHKDQDVQGVLACLKSLAEKTGAGDTACAAPEQDAGGNPLYRGGGSIAIIGAARSGLIVTQDPPPRTARGGFWLPASRTS